MHQTTHASVRFWAKVNKTPTCWLWTAALTDCGYGNFYVGPGKYAPAHRFSYLEVVGPVADGLHLDHLCRVRHCVNPDHLEPVTPRENALRGVAPGVLIRRAGVCGRGHERTPGNLNLEGKCRLCINLHQRARHQAKKSVA